MTSILKVDTIQDADGNNIINESGNTITIGASGDTTNIIGTLQNDGAAVGGVNTPAFGAYQSSNQSISNNTETIITLDTELYDTDNAFSSNTFTVPSNKSGKYFLYAQAGKSGWGANRMFISIRKNDSVNLAQGEVTNTSSQYGVVNVSILAQLAVGDTIVARIYQDSGSTQVLSGNSTRTFFYGYKIIE